MFSANPLSPIPTPRYTCSNFMRFSTGDKLGPYEIAGLIGKGGMGEVYRGTDTRLGRSVAIKVSSREFNDRFEREAKAISALNHPNICTLYDIGPNYLVMEFVEGELLSKIIERGPLPLDKALGYAVQIVDALAAAHAKGVIHRDLKPGNIIITKNGVKVLDFGLAKLTSERMPSASADNVETVTEPITRAGAILGTLYYMAPEQVEAKEADERSDIFSFGVVFYEMITGQRPFTGDTQAATLASLMKDQPPPMSQRQPAVPRALERVVRKCLEKKPDDRWHSARDLKPTLELIDLDAPPPSSASASVPIPVQTPEPVKKNWLWPAVAAAAIVAGAALALWAPWRKPAPTQAVRFEVGPSEKMTFITRRAMAVSPDGRWMVFPASGEDGQTALLHTLRSMASKSARCPARKDAFTPPAAWSYDSRWVVFARRQRQIQEGGYSGRTAAKHRGLSRPAGRSKLELRWRDHRWRMHGANPILRVPASGGQITPVTALAPGESGPPLATISAGWKTFPVFADFLRRRQSGRLYRFHRCPARTSRACSVCWPPTARRIMRRSPGGGLGHLIFLRGATLMAQPFDPDKMTLSGEPVAIADGVDSFAPANHGLFSVSDTGTLVYRGRRRVTDRAHLVRPAGQSRGHAGRPGRLRDSGHFSGWQPRGCRHGPAASRDIWILDVARGASTRFTFDPARDDNPAWSPDGKNIAFSSNRGGQMDLYIKPADGSGEEKLLLKTDEPKTVDALDQGRPLPAVLPAWDRRLHGIMWALPFPGEAKPVPLLQTQFMRTPAEGIAGRALAGYTLRTNRVPPKSTSGLSRPKRPPARERSGWFRKAAESVPSGGRMARSCST